MFAGSGSQKNRVWADLDFLPGRHELTLLLPSKPDKCWVDGTLTDLTYEREHRTARLQVATPALPVKPLDLSSGQAWVEKFDPSSGHWQSGPSGSVGERRALALWLREVQGSVQLHERTEDVHLDIRRRCNQGLHQRQAS